VSAITLEGHLGEGNTVAEEGALQAGDSAQNVMALILAQLLKGAGQENRADVAQVSDGGVQQPPSEPALARDEEPCAVFTPPDATCHPPTGRPLIIFMWA